jgi:hypothetical protein
MAPQGKWTMPEFLTFVKLQFQESFSDDFSTIPLPMVMTFHELACRCVEKDCCVGDKAHIAAPLDEDPNRWIHTICNRVEIAMDDICFGPENLERSEL